MVRTIRDDIEDAKAMGKCCVCFCDLEEYTSKAGNTYMATKGTTIPHFMWLACNMTWAQFNKNKEIYEKSRKHEWTYTKNDEDYDKYEMLLHIDPKEF